MCLALSSIVGDKSDGKWLEKVFPSALTESEMAGFGMKVEDNVVLFFLRIFPVMFRRNKFES